MADREDGQNPGRHQFDWPKAHDRIAAALRSVESADNPEPAAVRKALHERSVLLAKAPGRDIQESMIDLVVFLRGNQRLAFEAARIDAILPIAAITLLPRIAHHYLGLIGHRGGIYPLVDILPLLGYPALASDPPRQAVLISANGKTIAVAATAVEGFQSVAASSVAAGRDDELRHPAVAGITPDFTTVLDTARLLDDARLVIDEQPALRARTPTGVQ